MADLGELVGSLMVGIIRARRMADEQTAILAEYYRTNPLLEGLSVPRIRIPELTIDMPFLVEDQTEGESGQMEDPERIAEEAKLQLQATLEKHNIAVEPDFHKKFSSEVQKRLASAKQSGMPVVKETIIRNVQHAFADTVTAGKSELSASQKEIIAHDLRSKVSTVSIAKEPIPSGIHAGVRTADVKDRGSKASVAHLRITLKEEGLEWAVQSSESGGVTHTLQPE